MTLTIELTADEAERVRDAQQKGIDVTALMRGLLSGLPQKNAPAQTSATKGEFNVASTSPRTAENDATLALLEKWRKEAEEATPEEIEENERLLQEFKKNINATRAEAGARLIY